MVVWWVDLCLQNLKLPLVIFYCKRSDDAASFSNCFEQLSVIQNRLDTTVMHAVYTVVEYLRSGNDDVKRVFRSEILCSIIFHKNSTDLKTNFTKFELSTTFHSWDIIA